MADAYTSPLVLGYRIEIKETGGDLNEALLQLAVWTAAGLEKLWSRSSHRSATFVGHYSRRTRMEGPHIMEGSKHYGNGEDNLN